MKDYTVVAFTRLDLAKQIRAMEKRGFQIDGDSEQIKNNYDVYRKYVQKMFRRSHFFCAGDSQQEFEAIYNELIKGGCEPVRRPGIGPSKTSETDHYALMWEGDKHKN